MYFWHMLRKWCVVYYKMCRVLVKWLHLKLLAHMVYYTWKVIKVATSIDVYRLMKRVRVPLADPFIHINIRHVCTNIGLHFDLLLYTVPVFNDPKLVLLNKREYCSRYYYHYIYLNKLKPRYFMLLVNIIGLWKKGVVHTPSVR